MICTEILTRIVAFAFLMQVVIGHSCMKDTDCQFGKCDTLHGRCVCNFACTMFDKVKFVCTKDLKRPMTLCRALNLACEKQNRIAMTPFNITTFRKHKADCRAIDTQPTEQFCADQSYCSGNGMCLQRGSVTYCRCVSKYSGERCEIKKPRILESTNPRNCCGLVRRLLDGDMVGKKPLNSMNNQSNTYLSAIYLSTGVVTCAIAACAIFYMRRRLVEKANEKEGTNNACDTSKPRPDALRQCDITSSIKTDQSRIAGSQYDKINLQPEKNCDKLLRSGTLELKSSESKQCSNRGDSVVEVNSYESSRYTTRSKNQLRNPTN